MTHDISDELPNAFIDDQLNRFEKGRLISASNTDPALRERICELRRLKEMAVAPHTLGPELTGRHIAIIDVDDTPVFRRWYVVTMRAKVLSPPAEAFRYFILEHGEQHLARQFGTV